MRKLQIIDYTLKGMSAEEMFISVQARLPHLAGSAFHSVNDPEKKSPNKDAGQNEVQESSMLATLETSGSSKDESASDNLVLEEAHHDALNKASEPNFCDTFGKTVADELKLLPESRALEAIEEIEDILFSYKQSARK